LYDIIFLENMNFEGGNTMAKRAALKKEQPVAVQQAILNDNKTALSRMGRKGAEQANDNREARKAFDEHLASKRLQGDSAMREQANEHIVPVDGDDEREAA
jgi:hypothetical protein